MKNQITHKILTLSCMLLMLLCANISTAQTRRTAKPQSKESEQMKKAKAAWTPFYTKFRSALSSRNRKALRAMMSDDFDGRKAMSEGDWVDDNIRSWLSVRRTILARKPSQFQKSGYQIEDDNIISRGVEWEVGLGICFIWFEFRNDDEWHITYYGCGGQS